MIFGIVTVSAVGDGEYIESKRFWVFFFHMFASMTGETMVVNDRLDC